MPIDYRVTPGQPTVQVEIYLPKKAHYQGVLYRTLTEGFDQKQVEQHFRDHHADIALFLIEAGFSDLPIAIRLPENYFTGYSMYEVDGVYFSGGGIVEERTQVIRLLFSRDSGDLKQWLESFVFGYILYMLCQRIDDFARPEKEILVTFFGEVVSNQVVYKGAVQCQTSEPRN